MYIYIGIEDLAANALIELLDKKNKREVLFSELDNYGSEVLKILNSDGEKAILILSKERTMDFWRDYSEYFDVFTNGEAEGIRLKDDITLEKLWSKFRSYLSVDVIKAFIDEDSVRVLIGA